MYVWTLKFVSSNLYLQGDAAERCGAESLGELYCLSADRHNLDFLR